MLGCTHYPLLTDAIARVLKRQIMIVDSAQNCARAVRATCWIDNRCARRRLNRGNLQVALTDAADNFLDVASAALQLEIGEVQLREVLHPAKV